MRATGGSRSERSAADALLSAAELARRCHPRWYSPASLAWGLGGPDVGRVSQAGTANPASRRMCGAAWFASKMLGDGRAGFALQEVQDPAGDARGSAVEGWEGVGPRRRVRGMSGAEGGAESQPAVGEGQLRACAQVVGGVPQH